MVIGIYENKWRFEQLAQMITAHQLEEVEILLINDVKNTKHIDLLFVNIDMISEQKDVLELIKNKDQTDIVYILETVKYLQLLLENHRYEIITYPLEEDSIMKYVHKKYSSLKTSLTLKYGGGKENRTSVQYDSIYYISSNRRVIEVMGNDATGLLGKMYCKLDDIEKQLPETFIRCHKSYIVNSDKIKKKNSKFIYLKDVANPISISRAMKKNVL